MKGQALFQISTKLGTKGILGLMFFFVCGFNREFCTHMEMYFGEEDFSIKHTCVKGIQISITKLQKYIDENLKVFFSLVFD